MARALLVGLVLLLSGCLSPAPAADLEPSAALLVDLPGTLPFENTTYDLGVLVAQSPTFKEPSILRVRGQAYYPTEGAGPWPVVVLMHGNHFTCRGRLTPSVSAGTCDDTPLWTVERSHEGYGLLAEDLAARGFVVLSINANDVNDRNSMDDLGANQRAQLFLRTLDDLRDGKIAALKGKLDMDRVGIMGHSRGGDGAARATVLNAERPEAQRHRLLAVMTLAPTDFTRHLVKGVAFATILPYCDGDVSNLQGAWMYDDARLLDEAGPMHQFVVMGANHNWFNGVWYQDDSWWRREDAECKPGAESRLTPEAQREVGRLYMGAFFRRYLADETALDPILQEGTERVHVSYQSPARLLIDATLEEATNDVGGRVLAEGFTDAGLCEPQATYEFRQPVPILGLLGTLQKGTCPTEPVTSTAKQRTLAWSGPATFTEELPPTDATAFRTLTFRVGVDFEASTGPQDLRIVLRDGAGREASVLASTWTHALFDPPGGDDAVKITLNGVRIPLAAFDGVDLADLRAIELVFDQTPKGRVQLTDVALQ